jgi:ferrochelatase
LLQGFLGEMGHQVLVRHAMRYGEPAIGKALSALKAEGATRILVVPLYPQYSGATTASVMDEVFAWGRQKPACCPSCVTSTVSMTTPAIWTRWPTACAATGRQNGPLGDQGKLLMSFHGMPRRTLDLGDPYHCECLKTGRLLAERLGLSREQYVVTFQSRFGKAKWLEPYTEPTLHALAKAGTARVDVVCPGFVSDCIETLEEIAMEGKAAFLNSGGKTFHYIPCLNDQLDWMRALGQLVEQHLQGWPTRQEQLPSADTLSRQRDRALATGAKD